MYRYRPDYEIYARPIDEYPCKCKKAAAMMAMIQNNLDNRVAQHPHELIVYGGNGACFQVGSIPPHHAVSCQYERGASYPCTAAIDGAFPQP